MRGASPAAPLRTSAELRPLQFHCGKPPPAAEPRTLIIMAKGQMAMDGRLRQGKMRAASASRGRPLSRIRPGLLELECALEFQRRVGGDVGQAELNADIHGELHLWRAADSHFVVVVAFAIAVVVTAGIIE